MKVKYIFNNFIGRISGKRRRSPYSKNTHEYHNSCFTDLQHIFKRVHSWQFKEGDNEISPVKKLEMLLTYESIIHHKKYTRWFILLTILNIIVLGITAYIQS